MKSLFNILQEEETLTRNLNNSLEAEAYYRREYHKVAEYPDCNYKTESLELYKTSADGYREEAESYQYQLSKVYKELAQRISELQKFL
jgi:hypothetical protein